MIRAQGGDPQAALPTARHTQQVTASADGVMTELDALKVGIAAWRLGAGRARKEDSVSLGAGIEIHAKPGDTVTAGAPLLTLHTDDERRFATALQALEGAIAIGPAGAPVNRLPLILERIN
jgi:thymidine phosphorylase